MNAHVEGQTRAVYTKCMVNKMALGQGFHRALRFTLASY